MTSKIHNYSNVPPAYISGRLSTRYYALLSQELQRLRHGERTFVEGSNLDNTRELIKDTAAKILSALREDREKFTLLAEETTNSVPTYWELSVLRRAR